MSKGIRRQGRELALKIIYSLKSNDSSIEVVLDDFWKNFRFMNDLLGEPIEEFEGDPPREVKVFTEHLVRGVAAHLQPLDEAIRTSSMNWSLDRMSRVDLAILRLATYELLYTSDVPPNVAINEAIEIGKTFGTAETPSFVNGILDKISRSLRKG